MDKATLDLLTNSDQVPSRLIQIHDALNNSPILSSELECANQLRAILSSCALSYTTLASEPELLLGLSKHVGKNENNGALWTRFTVQYNLFAGSIVALGSQEQREHLFSIQPSGALGCFAFTECGTGVLSGAQCETTAVYDAKNNSFIIHSPTESSTKKWISQGMFAEYAVILANLMLENGTKNAGPHLFYTRIQVH